MTQETEKKYKKFYGFEIANNTDEKLYNIPLFLGEDDLSIHQIEKISYLSKTDGLSYNDVIKEIRQSGKKISTIIVYASGDYPKYVGRQLFCLLSSNLFPDSPRIFTLDPYQYPPDVRVTHFDDSIKELSSDSQITMSYLMPELKVIFHILVD